MSSIANNEKKTLYVLTGVFILCVLEYTFFRSKYISSRIEDFLTLLILGGTGVYIFFQPRARCHSKDRTLGFFFVWLFVCGLIYLVVYFGFGFLFGFGRNPYKRDFIGIARNILVFGGIIALKEWIRSFVINKATKKNVIMFGFIIALLYTAIEVNILDIINASGIKEITIMLSQKILPVLVLNFFLGYICYVTGYQPAIIYMLVTNIPIWLFDSLPNLEWIVTAILGIAFPVLALISLMETVDREGRGKNRKDEPKAKKTILWIFVLGFCIVVSFFTAGLFPVYPTVLVSNSMSPSINRGDVVIVESLDDNYEIQTNDIILFNAGDFDVVHRVVDIEIVDGTARYITKGDANEHTDNLNIETGNIGGVVIARIPYIGLPRLLIESTEHEEEINIK